MDPDDERLKVGQKQLVEDSAKWKGPSHKERQQERDIKKVSVGSWRLVEHSLTTTTTIITATTKTINPTFAGVFLLQPLCLISLPAIMFADLTSIFSYISGDPIISKPVVGCSNRLPKRP